MQSNNRVYIPEIDHLRAMAAVLVLLYHSVTLGLIIDERSSNPFLTAITEGHTAVGMFIVLSGFILSIGTVNKTIRYKPFLVARILRIYPMALVCLAAAIGIGKTDIIGVLTMALPLNAATLNNGIHGPFSAMLWAVAVEFQCYLLLPFLIKFSNERGSRFLFQVIAIGLALRAISILATDANARDISYWTILGRLDQFCAGIIAARLYLGFANKRLGLIWLLPAGLLVMAVLWIFNRFGGFSSTDSWKIIWPDLEGALWASFTLVYVAAGRALPTRLGKILCGFGQISYSFYLLHFAILTVFVQNSILLSVTGSNGIDRLLTTVLLVLPITALLALFSYHTIELPFLSLRPKYVMNAEITVAHHSDPP